MRLKILLVASVLVLLRLLPLALTLLNLVLLPSRWQHAAADSLISSERDNFDLTFASYHGNQSSTSSDSLLVPPILHHINLGPSKPRAEWMLARGECIRHHRDWETHIWDDEAAEKLVAEDFPHLSDMWHNYRYPVERVDALRYMVLQKHGGVVLDFDLACKRSLNPLRHFDFVAAAAHPTGFSIGFMMSSPGSAFVSELVDSLPRYNRFWFFLPYVAVMFSTGCHYASTIFTTQSNRTTIRILGGTPDSPHLHMLNGFAETPLFRHLGSSSWHSFDAALINWLGHLRRGPLVICLAVVSFVTSFVLTMCISCLRRRYFAKLHKRTPSISKYDSDDGYNLVKDA